MGTSGDDVSICKERKNFAREAGGIFDVRIVWGVDLGVVSAGNMIRQKMAIGRRGGGVVSSGNYQGRNSNVGDDGTRVKVPDSAASADVTFGVHRLNRVEDCGDDVSGVCLKRGCEPTRRRRPCDLFHALR